MLYLSLMEFKYLGFMGVISVVNGWNRRFMTVYGEVRSISSRDPAVPSEV